MNSVPRSNVPAVPTVRTLGTVAAASVAAMVLCVAPEAMAAPVSIYYYKDAQAHNTTGTGSSTPNIFFATPIQGVAGPTYTQASQTVSATGAGATSSTTYEASISAGTLRASSASTISGSFGGNGGLGSSAEQILRFRDTLNASGGTVGSTVSLNLTLQLDALLSYFNVPTSSGTLCNYGSVALFASINQNQIASLGENLCSGSQNQTMTVAFDAIVGTDFDLEFSMDILTQSAVGAGSTLGSGVSIDAMNTGQVFFAAPTGYQLSSVSGYSYLQGGTGPGGGTVPEPGTLALVAAAVFGLPLGRRLRPVARR